MNYETVKTEKLGWVATAITIGVSVASMIANLKAEYDKTLTAKLRAQTQEEINRLNAKLLEIQKQIEDLEAQRVQEEQKQNIIKVSSIGAIAAGAVLGLLATK
jgi:septal ring factor EnvC (AmiA/AmiB activator)